MSLATPDVLHPSSSAFAADNKKAFPPADPGMKCDVINRAAGKGEASDCVEWFTGQPDRIPAAVQPRRAR